MIIEEFLREIARGIGDDLRASIEIRALAVQDGATEQMWFGTSHIQGAAAACAELCGSHNVYVGVLPRCGRRGYAQDVMYGGWLFVDVDGGSEGPDAAMSLVTHAPVPMPHMVVGSGGGVHCYWRISPVVLMTDRQRYQNILKRLVRTIGGEAPGAHADPAATDVARVLRVPGTWNHKYDPPRAVDLVLLDSDREAVSLEDWDRMLRPLPVRVSVVVGPPSVYRANGTADIIGRASAGKHGDAFKRLFCGNCSDYGGDESRADMALMMMLAYWCDRDPDMMLKVFALSGLGRREKWVTREDYRKRTLDRALGRV